MLFDDRLATVLGSPVGGAAAARTQYRQLVDLLGSADPAVASPLADVAQQRLVELAGRISPDDRSAILREPGLRLRNPHLVAVLAEDEAKPAAAALAVARLSDDQWQELIPQLPVMARGFLRHRRDLPPGTRRLLQRLGAGDMLLPRPDEAAADAADELVLDVAEALPPPGATTVENDGIRALLRRIEAFREGRRPGSGDPRLPLGDVAAEPGGDGGALGQFAFTADRLGRIDWAEGALAPLVCGLRLGAAAPGALAVLGDSGAEAMRRLQPLRGAALTIDAAPVIAGDWRVDAEPVFASAGGRFGGWRGRIRRPLIAPPDAAALAAAALPPDTEQDRMRQVLHELRTPVNAIQGFAEIIQQQLFGHTPNAYRAHAAAIAVDAARLLGGFEELERLARLESGMAELDDGQADLAVLVRQTMGRMAGVLQPRNAAFVVAGPEEGMVTALAHEDLVMLVWRVLASLAGALAPTEEVTATLDAAQGQARLAVALPATLARADDLFTLPQADQRPVLAAGMFGTGFTLRLARAEAEAAGGSLVVAHAVLVLELPLLTGC